MDSQTSIGTSATVPTGTLDVLNQSASRIGLIVKGAASQTANLQEWQNSAGTVLASVTNDGRLTVGTSTADSDDAWLTVRKDASDHLNSVQHLQTAAGGQAYQNKIIIKKTYSDGSSTTGAIVGSVDGVTSNGTSEFTAGSLQFTHGSVAGRGNLSLYTSNFSTLTKAMSIDHEGRLYVGNASPSTNARLFVDVQTANLVGSIIQGAASQTANLQEWQNSDGTIRSYVDSAGKFILGAMSISQASGVLQVRNSTYGDIATFQGESGTIKLIAGNKVELGSSVAYVSSGQLVMTNNSGNVIVNNSYGGSSSGVTIRANGNAGVGAPVVFETNNGTTETMRITGAGNVGIGMTPSYRFDVGFTGTTSGDSWVARFRNNGSGGGQGDGVLIESAASTDTSNPLLVRSTSGVNYFAIQSNGYMNMGNIPLAANYGQLAIQSNSSSIKTLVLRGAASQSANLQEWQNNAGTVLASISAGGNLEVIDATVNGNLVVDGTATFNGTLTVNGHIISGNTSGSTTIAAGVAAGVGASASISGNDTAGTVTLTTGTGAISGALATITFASSYGSAPRVMLAASDADTAALQIYRTSTTTTFVINAASAPTDSTTYEIDYFVVQ